MSKLSIKYEFSLFACFFFAPQIFFELIFGPPRLLYLKFGPLVQKVGHPCSNRSFVKNDKKIILKKTVFAKTYPIQIRELDIRPTCNLSKVESEMEL